MKQLRHPFYRGVALAAAAGLTLSCSSSSGGPYTDGSGDDGPNQASESVEAFNGASSYLQLDMQQVADAVSGPNGLVVIVDQLEALDLSDPSDRARWGELTAQFETQLSTLETSLASAAVSAIEMADHEVALQRMRVDALAGTLEDAQKRPKFVSLATVFVVTATAITLTRVYRNIRDLSHRNQNLPVRRVATSGEQGRQAIVDALESQGVDVPDGASGDQVADLFEQQSGRYARAHVTQVARDFNITHAGDGTPTGDAATQNMVDQIQDNAQAARDGGVVATDAVVNLSTAGPSGLGAGVDGTMLVLTATETTPNDFINHHVDAVVATRETQPLETTPPTVPEEEARQRLRDAADGTGDPPTPDEAAEFVESVVAALREQAEQFSPLTALPMRIAFGTTTLEDDATGPDGALRGEMTATGFTTSEPADVLLVRQDAQPIEVSGHPIGPDSPITVTHTPLLGTLQLSAVPDGPEVDGSRMWSAEVTIRSVATPTQIVVDGVNVSVSPRVLDAPAAGGHFVTVEAFDNATLRARRLDTGESYLIALTAEDDQDQCPGVGTFACGDGDIICADIVCNGRDDCADGSDEAADVCGDPTHCCVATQGCPAETGSSCAETCCCCPYGQVCDREDFSRGCVPE